MFGTHTIINVKYLGNQKGMTYFCDSNIFGVISKYFWHLPFWSHCIFENNIDNVAWTCILRILPYVSYTTSTGYNVIVILFNSSSYS